MAKVWRCASASITWNDMLLARASKNEGSLGGGENICDEGGGQRGGRACGEKDGWRRIAESSIGISGMRNS